jgi:hypothetical protein
MGILDTLFKKICPEKKTTSPCRKCGKLITKSASTIVVEATEYGYCPVCKKLFCRQCAGRATLSDNPGDLECPTCNVLLKGSL